MVFITTHLQNLNFDHNYHHQMHSINNNKLFSSYITPKSSRLTKILTIRHRRAGSLALHTRLKPVGVALTAGVVEGHAPVLGRVEIPSRERVFARA